MTRPRPHRGGGFSRAQRERTGVGHLGERVVPPPLTGGERVAAPPCRPRAPADGIEPPGETLSSVPVQELEAVEPYSIATLPPEFGGGGSACRSIVVGTQHG